jgi:hypothetical protein
VVLSVAQSIVLNNGMIVISKLGPVLKEAVVVRGEVPRPLFVGRD